MHRATVAPTFPLTPARQAYIEELRASDMGRQPCSCNVPPEAGGPVATLADHMILQANQNPDAFDRVIEAKAQTDRLLAEARGQK